VACSRRGRGSCGDRRYRHREVCRVDGHATLPRLVDEIEVLGASAGDTGLADGVRKLIEHLRYQADAIMSLADRLERLAFQQ